MTDNHTPGPWLCDGKAVYFLDWDGESYEDGRPQMSNRWFLGLQGQTWTSGTGCPPRCSEAELEANARLIAAAPDMYAALKLCLRLLKDIQAEPGLVQKAVKNALAKAEGRS